jgi:two-component system, sensor histidine kinase PdtaS
MVQINYGTKTQQFGTEVGSVACGRSDKRGIGGRMEAGRTLNAITSITSKVMGVDSCSIYLKEEKSSRLVLKATTGLAREAIGNASLEFGEGLTGWTVTHGQPVAIRDALTDPRFKLLPEAREEGLRSLMAVPLSIQGRTIGAINVQTAVMRDFTADEIELLSLIANLAAGALEKAALHDRMAQQIQELSTLAEVSRTVTSPLYLDEMLGSFVAWKGSQSIGVVGVDNQGPATILINLNY